MYQIQYAQDANSDKTNDKLVNLLSRWSRIVGYIKRNMITIQTSS